MSDRITEKQKAFALAFGKLCMDHGIVAGSATVEIRAGSERGSSTDWFNVQLETSAGFHPKVHICHHATLEIDGLKEKAEGPQVTIIHGSKA